MGQTVMVLWPWTPPELYLLEFLLQSDSASCPWPEAYQGCHSVDVPTSWSLRALTEGVKHLFSFCLLNSPCIVYFPVGLRPSVQAQTDCCLVQVVSGWDLSGSALQMVYISTMTSQLVWKPLLVPQSAVWFCSCLHVRWMNPQAQSNLLTPVKYFCLCKYAGRWSCWWWGLTAGALLEQCLGSSWRTWMRETCEVLQGRVAALKELHNRRATI